MKRIRIGNDIVVRWKVSRMGHPENFQDKAPEVMLIDSFGKQAEVEYEINSNVVTILFKGKNQEKIGTYCAKLVENRGADNMFTIDKCDIFALVSTNSQECCCDAEAATGTVYVDTESNLVVPTNGIDGVGIAKIEQTEYSTESAGENRIKITLTNGTEKFFSIYNGEKGERGERGLQGERGERGERGEQGLRGERGERGEQGVAGVDGKNGVDGSVIFPSVHVDGAGYLVVDIPDEAGDSNNLSIDKDGYLCVEYPDIQ